MSHYDLNNDCQLAIDRDDWRDETNDLDVKNGSKSISELIRQYFLLKKTGGNNSD